MAGECQKLKFNRRRLGLSQKEFADKVGLCQYTISKLEKNEDAWAVANAETIDKIYALYENMSSYQPNSRKEVKDVVNDIKNEESLIETGALELLGSCKKETKADTEVCSPDGLSVDDKALKKLINVAHAGMNGANNHEEFKSYVKLLKKLLKKY